MKSLARKRPDLKIRLIKRSDIPTDRPHHLEKGYWDSVVHRLSTAAKGEAFELFHPGGHSPISMKSALHKAAIRVGKRVTILVRGDKAYAWMAGDRETPSSQAREPIICKVCGKPIVRPKVGGSRQVVHAGKGNRKSECQKVLRIARTHSISIAEAKERRARRASRR